MRANLEHVQIGLTAWSDLAGPYQHQYCTHGQQVPPEALALTLSWFKEAKGIDVLMLLTMDLGTGEGTVRVSRRFDDKEEAFRELALQGKKTLFTTIEERHKDLLGLIHTDVCGLFRTVSRQGASYFVTFTDDFSRYGYVYLLKHKHEVFETFKVFQKEVENQLRKTIKSLHSDRGGEYMSQEFLDHLKEHGIIAHRTPPYTPQNNGVSAGRNRTLLDMVRSMMSQTTFPKSFWYYALETAARILNMVPTKKVDKTPYEIWHGQAPKLSYLKV
ncbi:retrotransposon protein, putative, ty1-copia subclass [Tanacetum coccineum]|uniref:Retrotransposon protein, putative, ty1-copia subclass n=1 Tax=Tanacetum coccineum TaxID=301880 RepID=A0ABQ5DMI3_9ASTR